MLPNIRKLFIPDDGYTLFDIDLSSADLRIVTWEADCRLMKQWFADELDPYTMIAREYFHEPTMTKHDARRQQFKSLAHATNYLGRAAGIAGNSNIRLNVMEVGRIQHWYFKLFPEIKQWQEQLVHQIKTTMEISNAFGYKFKFLDRLTDHTFNEGVAWIPQSTVGIVINHAMHNIFHNLPAVQLLLQVHDSLVGQYPTSMPELHDRIIEESQIVIPYNDPLIIPVGIKQSAKSWGDCQ